MLKRKFRVVKIEAPDKYNIILTLVVIRPDKPDPSKIIEPKFKTEDERIGWRVGKAMMQAMIGLDYLRHQRIGVPIGIPIVLTRDEYEKIGSPSINQVLTFELIMKVEK